MHGRDDIERSTGRARTHLGAEATCTRLGAANQITKQHPHRFRHTADTIVQDELGDPLVTADHFGHHGLGSVAGYAKISTHRRQEASLALGRRGRRAAEPGCRASASLKECIRRLADAEHPLILPRRRSME